MKTVQLALDEALLEAMDEAVKHLETTRSAFTSDALREALEHLEIVALEKQHRLGYEKYPVQAAEFDVWETEQDWGDQ